MDIAAIAGDVVAFLGPFLPYLVKAGEKAAEEAGKKLGANALEKAKALWSKLRGNEEVERAGRDTAAMPDDPDAQAAFRLQVKKLLEQNEALAREVMELMDAARRAAVTVSATGARSIAVGGSMSSGTLITGDGNVVGDRSSSEVKQ